MSFIGCNTCVTERDMNGNCQNQDCPEGPRHENRIRAIAMIAHEVNRAYCEAIGDNSQPWWFEAPQWQKESAIDGVVAHIRNPSMTPEQSHEGWMRHKLADGWKWGPVKDPTKKEHPCIMPYEQLPLAQRVKDHLFKAVVTACHKEIER